ncbi:MAG: 5-formyltetrahydrofolate cyclo-ligase [Jatrophihabitans sp.]
MTDKARVRAMIATARAARTAQERDRCRAAIREHVTQWCRRSTLAPGSRVAAYEPLPTEPGSVALLAGLTAAGYQVIVPTTLPDRDLDWTVWCLSGDPTEPLGVAAITAASLVLVPAFAVDPAGNRLGRGGGSYDRALERVNPRTPVAALIYSEEFLTEVPTDPWDRPVSAAVTPDGWFELTPSGYRNSP